LTWFVAKDAQHANALVRRGLFLTLLLAFALALVIALLAPFIATQVWGDANLTTPLRVASLDFLAFAPFAVMVQILNGLRRYTLQAVTWFSYSTSKVVFVLVMLATVGGVQGAILGYVLASLVGSIVAIALGRKAIPKLEASSKAPTARSLFRLGLPFAALSLSLMAFLNADLWVVKPHETALRASAYAAAATLGRALFFIFRAFGDALFPAVVRAAESNDDGAASRHANTALSWLMLLLVPIAGLAAGGARGVMAVIYVDAGSESFEFLRILAVTSAFWTVAAVLGLLLGALGRPWQAASALLAITAIACFGLPMGAEHSGALGVAWVALFLSALGMLALAFCIHRRLPGSLPLRAFLVGTGTAVVLERLLAWANFSGFWVFPAGAALLMVALGGLKVAGVLPALPVSKKRA
jgi:O-antigen/teichoic acid export membrane protein